MERTDAGAVAFARCSLLTFALLAVGASTAASRAASLERLEGGTISVTEFERRVEASMRKAGVAGLSCTILNDGRIVYSREFGWKDGDAKTAMDDSTVFAAASLSKPVFAYLITRLVAAGHLDLDRPLQSYLPKPLSEYASYADLAADPRAGRITARMALSHTTGFPNLRAFAPDGRLRIRSDPGSRFAYSGEGIALLQFVVETLMHADLESLARQHVFAPLGMARTSYVWRDAYARNIAMPHNEHGWPQEPSRPPTAAAAGSMITTSRDYARLLVHILATSRSEPHGVDLMLTPAVRITSRRMFGTPKDSAGGARVPDSLAWGLGWGLFDSPAGRAFFHTGHGTGAQNYVVVFRDRGIGIVLLSNSDNFEAVASEVVAAGIGDRYSPFNWLGYEPFDPAKPRISPRRHIAIPVSAAVIAPYAGKYRLSVGDALSFVKAEGARLWISDDGQSWDEIFAESDTLFFLKGRNVTFGFVKGADGRVTRIDIDNDGTKLTARPEK
jgi:CubicO group peptidase (beta-lactamase class C family)